MKNRKVSIYEWCVVCIDGKREGVRGREREREGERERERERENFL